MWASSVPVPPTGAFFPKEIRTNGAFVTNGAVQPVAAPAAPVGVTPQTVSKVTVLSARQGIVATLMPVRLLVKTLAAATGQTGGFATIELFATA